MTPPAMPGMETSQPESFSEHFLHVCLCGREKVRQQGTAVKESQISKKSLSNMVL